MWSGWWRRSHNANWQRVCQAETLDAAHKALMAAVKGKRVRNTDLYLTGGHTPPAAKHEDLAVHSVQLSGTNGAQIH